MSQLEVLTIPCLNDNYAFIIYNEDKSFVACVDTPELSPILKALEDNSLKLTHILTTHHHYDHIGYHEKIKSITGCKIIGNSHDQARIPGIDILVDESKALKIADIEIKFIETPGHTIGHICYYFEEQNIIFTGDTLFSLGCGRLFEGTADMMWSSLQKLQKLPPNTLIYPAHEYTLTNINFTLTLDKNNQELLNKKNEVIKLRNCNKPSLPVTLAEEQKLNPFLRAGNSHFASIIGKSGKHPVEIFSHIRELRNIF